MSFDLRVLEGVLQEPVVLGAAIFRADRSVLHRGLTFPAGGLADVAVTARHLFRETHPSILVLDLEYEAGRAVLVPLGSSVLLLCTTAEAKIQALLDRVRQVPESQSQAPAALPRDPRRTALDAMNTILTEVRTKVGGPVIRNYLKKAQRDVRAVHPSVDALSITLAGTVDAGVDAIDSESFVRALGALTRSVLAHLTTVEGSFAQLDIEAATAHVRAELLAHGFYDRAPPPGTQK